MPEPITAIVCRRGEAVDVKAITCSRSSAKAPRWLMDYAVAGAADQVIRPQGSCVRVAMSVLALAPAPAGLGDFLRAKRGSAVDSRLVQTDEELLSLVGSGDKQAFATLFARYAPKVKSYLMRLGATAAAAEDLAQDAMVSMWR